MFKKANDTIAISPGVVCQQGERFLKTIKEIEGEFLSYANLQTEAGQTYSPAFLIYKKMEEEEMELNRNYSPILEENY